MILKDKICLKTSGIISKSSCRDTIIVNCQLSIVNSAKPVNSNLSGCFFIMLALLEWGTDLTGVLQLPPFGFYRRSV